MDQDFDADFAADPAADPAQPAPTTGAPRDSGTPRAAGLHPETLIVSRGRGGHGPGRPMNLPVDFTSTYSYAPGAGHGPAPSQLEEGLDADSALGGSSEGQAAPDYAREGVPSWVPLEDLLAELEAAPGTQASGLLFSSGMAALSAVVHLMRPGGHLIMPRHSYQGLAVMAQQLADRGTVTVHRVDIAETAAVEQTLRDVSETARAEQAEAMLWIESPTNPMLEVADLPALTRAARDYGVRTAVDNTFATPMRQRPLLSGADIVVHSVTKFLSGHSDLIMGAVVTADPSIQAELHTHRTLHGAIPGPMEVFLALRGVRTLAVRLNAAEATAGSLAEQLEGLSRGGDLPVGRVVYPGLRSHPQHERAGEQLAGYGAILTVDAVARGGRSAAEVADAVLARLKVWTPATSLGGVESLAERRRRHAGEPETVPEGLIRLSVGIERAEDLYADLLQALQAVARDNPAE